MASRRSISIMPGPPPAVGSSCSNRTTTASCAACRCSQLTARTHSRKSRWRWHVTSWTWRPTAYWSRAAPSTCAPPSQAHLRARSRSTSAGGRWFPGSSNVTGFATSSSTCRPTRLSRCTCSAMTCAETSSWRSRRSGECLPMSIWPTSPTAAPGSKPSSSLTRRFSASDCAATRQMPPSWAKCARVWPPTPRKPRRSCERGWRSSGKRPRLRRYCCNSTPSIAAVRPTASCVAKSRTSLTRSARS